MYVLVYLKLTFMISDEYIIYLILQVESLGLRRKMNTLIKARQMAKRMMMLNSRLVAFTNLVSQCLMYKNMITPETKRPNALPNTRAMDKASFQCK